MSDRYADRLREAANVLNTKHGYTVALNSIMESRDRAPRRPDDRDSDDLLTDLIADLRAAADLIDGSR